VTFPPWPAVQGGLTRSGDLVIEH